MEQKTSVIKKTGSSCTFHKIKYEEQDSLFATCIVMQVQHTAKW